MWATRPSIWAAWPTSRATLAEKVSTGRHRPTAGPAHRSRTQIEGASGGGDRADGTTGDGDGIWGLWGSPRLVGGQGRDHDLCWGALLRLSRFGCQFEGASAPQSSPRPGAGGAF